MQHMSGHQDMLYTSWVFLRFDAFLCKGLKPRPCLPLSEFPYHHVTFMVSIYCATSIIKHASANSLKQLWRFNSRMLKAEHSIGLNRGKPTLMWLGWAKQAFASVDLRLNLLKHLDPGPDIASIAQVRLLSHSHRFPYIVLFHGLASGFQPAPSDPRWWAMHRLSRQNGWLQKHCRVA